MTDPIILPNGNLLVPLTADRDGLQALVWIDALIQDRNGTTPLPPETGITDKWRISRLVRASLAYNGVVQLDERGRELETTPPAGYQSDSVDVARLLHDQRIGQAIALLRSASYDWLAGKLVPSPIPTPVSDPTSTTAPPAPESP